MKPEKKFFERYVKGFCVWQVLVLTLTIVAVVLLQTMIFPEKRMNAVYLYYVAGYFFFFGLLSFMGYAFLRSSGLTAGGKQVLRKRFVVMSVAFTLLAYLLFVLLKANDAGLFSFIFVLFYLVEMLFCVEYLLRLSRKKDSEETNADGLVD